MYNKYKQLSLEERCRIACLHEDGRSIRQIAATLDRTPSTVAREIKRNKQKKGYEPAYAQLQSAGRRWRGSRLERNVELRDTVLERLTLGWSPQQIVGRLTHENGSSVISHESIYRFIYAQIRRSQDYTWRNYLPRAKSKRGCRGRKGGSPVLFIKDRTSISQRPIHVASREEPGHWEADLMLFSKYGQAILAVHERHSRLLLLFKLNDKKAINVLNQLKALFTILPHQLAKSVTFDNGTEFAEHHRLHELGMKTYFCDVRSPWQKGGVENAIGRTRRPLPRKTNLDNISTADINHYSTIYNHTPRKCLDFKSPAEIFSNQLLHFKCEITSQRKLG